MRSGQTLLVVVPGPLSRWTWLVSWHLACSFLSLQCLWL